MGDDDPNADLFGYVMEFTDKSRWKVVETDGLLGAAYVRLEQIHPPADQPYQRIQNAGTVRRRKELELIKAGQGSLFEGPS